MMYAPYMARTATNRARFEAWSFGPDPLVRTDFENDLPAEPQAIERVRKISVQGSILIAGRPLAPAANSSSTVVKLEAPWEASLQRQKDCLLALAPNWDGYGAPALEPRLINMMFDHLRGALLGRGASAPDVIPGGDGSLQAEWHLRNFDLVYHLDEDGSPYAWVRDRATGEEREFFKPDAYRALAENVTRLEA